MIVVGGESLVDLVPSGSGPESGVPLLAPRLGGGPYNVALSAGRLGADTAFLSRVSTDPFGAALLERLHASGVETGLVQRGTEPTSLAVVTLDEWGVARYGFYTSGTVDRLFADPGALPGPPFALSLGTLGMVLDPGAGAYEAVLRREYERGVLTALDPNIRAELITDPAAYRARFAAWLPYVRLLKLSVEDAAWLADVDTAAAPSAIESWLDAGVRAVVLTRGEDGLAVYTADGERARVATGDVTVADTIGAGDTVQGALLAWLHGRGETELRQLPTQAWDEALTFAANAAAITVSRAGAEPPTRDELENSAATVRGREIASGAACE